ncbi:MAG: Rab family GTPase [Candidatus Atabeyarchaeum deiterrae]
MRARTFKVIVVGEGGVGKTSLVRRYVDRVFTEGTMSTIGVDLSSKTILNDGVEEILQIWDLGGQPRFRNIADLFFKGASGAIAVFDVTRKETLCELSDWIKHLRFVTGSIPLVFVGNKVDLRTSRDHVSSGVSREEAIRFAQDYSSPYVEASARKGSGVEEAFKALVVRLGA